MTYERTRILLYSGHSLHSLMWVDAGKDKSIYVGMMDPDRPVGVAHKDNVGQKLDITDLVFEPSHNPKISYHETGQIHFRDQDIESQIKNHPRIITNWRAIEFPDGAPKTLALFHYPHISQLPFFEGLANKCQVIPYERLVNVPMAGKIISAPLGFDDRRIVESEYEVIAGLSSSFCKLYIVLHRIANPENLPVKKWHKSAGFLIPKNPDHPA